MLSITVLQDFMWEIKVQGLYDQIVIETWRKDKRLLDYSFVPRTIRTTCRPFVPWTIRNTDVVWFSW